MAGSGVQASGYLADGVTPKPFFGGHRYAVLPRHNGCPRDAEYTRF